MTCSQVGTLVIPSPQLETAKKAYHLACKEEKLAMTREMNSKAEQSVTPEQQKKLQDKVDKCKQDVQKVPVGWGAVVGWGPRAPWSGSWLEAVGLGLTLPQPGYP